jgi:hypothetical protein
MSKVLTFALRENAIFIAGGTSLLSMFLRIKEPRHPKGDNVIGEIGYKTPDFLNNL